MFKTAIVAAILAVSTLTMVDHGMRLSWANECRVGDQIQCPDKLWWFARSCETDGECEAIGGPASLSWASVPASHERDGYDADKRLAGYGCEGAKGKVLLAVEEDELPRCARIEEL